MIILENDVLPKKIEHNGLQIELSNIDIDSLKEELDKFKEDSEIIDNKSHISIKNIKSGQKFYGTITTTIANPDTGKKVRTQITSTFEVVSNQSSNGRITVKDTITGKEYKTSRKGTQLKSKTDKAKSELKKKAIEKEIAERERKQKEFEEKAIDFKELDTPAKLKRTIEAGIKNIWLCGPAGSGKSVMTRNLAKELNLPYLCISCGIGTSSTEFVGYKYPTREGTKFAEYYSKPSIILLDEFTALDPAVAQICNAALANNEIETTTGTVYRDPNCIIVATSNTFGGGASRQYVANNQLDASTIDRFVGGIIEVDYSEEYESQYDKEVVSYVRSLRNIIKNYDFRRVASTRMIQAGCALKKSFVRDWKKQLVVNWSDNEKHIIDSCIQTETLAA